MSVYLVTGAAGFIGSHVCDRLLAEGRRVVAVDDLSHGRIANLAEARGYGPQFSFEHLDVCSPEFRALMDRHRPEVLMHLAAQSSVERSVRDPVQDAQVNIMGLLNLLEGAVAAGTRKVVFAASGGTLYGDPDELPVAEPARAASRPISPYGITKKVAEDYLRMYRRERGLDYTALALGNVYGPRQDPNGEAGVVAIFASAMIAGKSPTLFGDGAQTRDYVFVDDVVDAFARAASAEHGSGELVNIGTGVESSVNRVFELLAGLCTFRREPRHGPPRKGEVRRMALDVSLAAETLGWVPWTRLEEGLHATVEYLREG